MVFEDDKVWFTVPEAAEYLGVTERWVRRQIEDRHIRFNRLGATIRFRRDDLDALIEDGFVEAHNGPPKTRGYRPPKAKRHRRAA